MPEERRRRTSRRERSSPLELKREVATVRCPFCHDDVPQDALAARCGKCQTVHHASCFDEKKGCSVDGCGGKAARVVKGWRASLGDCRACSGKVYLDENVAICARCESQHHPFCLEARDGCAECGSGEGMLVSAAAVHAAAPSPALKAWSAIVVIGLVAATFPINLSTAMPHVVKIAVTAGVAFAAFLAVVGSAAWARWRRSRAFGVAERVVTVKPAPGKPEG